MKTVLLFLLLAASVLTGGGCVLMSPEDRDFYGSGWIKPSDLDKPMPHHAITDPSRPQQVASAPSRVRSAEPEPQWLVPEPGPQ